MTGEKISVGAPFFNMTFGPIMLPLLIAMPFGPLLAWKRGDILAVTQRLYWVAALSFVAIVASFAIAERGPWLAPFGIGIGLWIIGGAVSEITFRSKLFRAPLGEVWRRARGLPRSAYGTMFAHLGMGVTVLGIVATSAWQSEKIVAMKPGQGQEIAGYRVVFGGVAPRTGPNYKEIVGLFTVTRNGELVTRLNPSKRNFPVQKQITTEAGILNSVRGDLYIVLGDKLKDGAYTVRVYFNPLVRLIWIGTLVMFLGGFLSLTDRRLRIGAPKRARVAPHPAPAE